MSFDYAIGQPQGAVRTAAEGVSGSEAERDQLAVLLAQIEVYQPGIVAKAQAWVVQVDGAAGVADAGGKRDVRTRRTKSRYLKNK